MRRFLSCFIAIFALMLLAFQASYAQPTVQARYVAFSNITQTAAKVSWINGNGGGRLVVISIDNSWEDITSYATTNFSATNGSVSNQVQLGSSNDYVIGYTTGATRTINLSGLTAGTTYYIRIYEYNGSHGAYQFATNNGLNNPRSFTTLASLNAPTWAVTPFTIDQNSNTVVLNWDAVSGASGYYVNVSTGTGGAFDANRLADYTDLDVGNATTHEIYLPIAGTYYVAIKAYSSSAFTSTSPYSSEQTLSITTSMPPKFLAGDQPTLTEQAGPNYGFFDITINFDQAVYSANDNTGALSTSSFAAYAPTSGPDASSKVVISAVSHSAGQSTATITVRFNDRVAAGDKFRIGPANATSIYSAIIAPATAGVPMNVSLNATKGGQYSADITCPELSVLNTNDNIAFGTIQKAIDATTTAAGEIIQLKENTTYSENVTVNKAVTLTDQNTNNAIVTGKWTLGGSSDVDLSTNTIAITGLTFQPNSDASILVGNVYNGTVSIQGNTFTIDNAADIGISVQSNRGTANLTNLNIGNTTGNTFSGAVSGARAIYFNNDGSGLFGIVSVSIQQNTFPATTTSIAFENTDLSTFITNAINLGNNNTNSDGMIITSKYVYSHDYLNNSTYLYPGIAVLAANQTDLEAGIGDAYHTVADAIAASSNDGTETVFLGQGTYTEAIALNEAVKLQGKASSIYGTVLTNTVTANATADATYAIYDIYFDIQNGTGINISALTTTTTSQTLFVAGCNFQVGENETGVNVSADTIPANITLDINSNDFFFGHSSAKGINIPNTQILGLLEISSNTFDSNPNGGDKSIYISTTNSTGASSGDINIYANLFTGIFDAIVFEDAVNNSYSLSGATINIYDGNDFSQTGYGIKINDVSTYNGFIGSTLPNTIDLYETTNGGNTNFDAADIYGAAWYDLTGDDTQTGDEWKSKLYPSIQTAETANSASTLYIGAGTYAENVTFDGTVITHIIGHGATCELATGYTATLGKDFVAINNFVAPTVVIGSTSAYMDDAIVLVKSNGTIRVPNGTNLASANSAFTANKPIILTRGVSDVGLGGTLAGTVTIANENVTVSYLDFTGNPAITVAPTTGITSAINIQNNAFTLVNGGDGILVQTGNASATGSAALNITGNSFAGGDATSKAIHFRNQTTGFANFSGVNVYDGNTFNTPGYNFYKTQEGNICTYLPSVDVNNTTNNTYTTTNIFGFYLNPAATAISASTNTIVTDCNAPAAFTTGAVTPVGGNVVAGYFNSTNTSVNVSVPIANDTSLAYGTVQIQIDNDGDNTWVNVANSGLATINPGDINGTKTITVLKADLVGSGDFDEGTTIQFRAVITDFAQNSTNGSPSSNTIYRDETAPTVTFNSATADNIINIAEKAAGFNVNAQSNENNTTLYVVNTTDNTPTYSNITTVGFASANAPTAGNAVNIAVSADNTNIVDGKTYKVFGMDQAGNLSAASTGSFTTDLTAPAAPTNVVINGGNPINNSNKSNTTLSFEYTEAATYSYTYTTSGGSGTVTVTDANASGSPVNLSNIDLSGLEDGTITVSVTVKDAAGNPSAPATDTELKDVVAPNAPTVLINGGNPINASNYTSVSLQITGEVGTTYTYTFTPDNGNPVTGSGTLDVSPKTITGINLTNILDGTVTASVTLTDAAGNVSTAGTDTELKDIVAPATFTTGSVTTVTNPVAGWWNSDNTQLDVQVPVDNDASLMNGNIKLYASKDNFANEYQLGSTYTIAAINTTYTFNIPAAQFEALTGFAEGDVWKFRAVITDVAGNSTTGSASSTTITVDQTAPTATFVSATADNIINIAEKAAGFNVVAQSNEATGTLYVVDVTTNPTSTYANIGTHGFATNPVTQANTDINIAVGANNTNIITGSTYKVYAIDAAGNLSSASSGSFTTDLVAPTITSITSTTADGLYGIGSQINFTLNLSEAAIFNANGGSAALDLALTTGTTDAVRTTDQTSSTTLELTYTVVNGDSKTDLTWTDGSVVLSGGATWTDAAGNPVTLTTPGSPNDAAAFASARAINIDGIPPTFTVAYHLNSVTGPALGVNPTIGIGTNYYIKITASEELSSNPTISIGGLAAGPPTNNVSNASTFTHIANTVFSYNRQVVETSDDGVDELITITGTDLAGNTATNVVPTNAYDAVAAASGYQAKVDGKRPTPTITLAAPVDYNDGTNDWTNNNPIAVTINYGETVQNVSNSVVSVTNGTKSNFANSNNTVFTLDVTPTSEGTVTVSVPEGDNTNQIKDAGGNFAYSATKSINYDATAPTTTDNVPSDWQTAPFTITFSPNDGSGSGVAKVYYTSTGNDPDQNSSYVNAPLLYQVTFNTDGQFTIKYRAEDNVGNLEAVKTAANLLKIDQTAPVIQAGTITAPTTSTIWNGGNHNITWTATNISDATSGLATNPISLYYTTNASDANPTWTLIASGLANNGSYTWNVPDSINSTHVKVRIDAVDNAGNTASQVSGTFTIDNTPPTANILITANNYPISNGYTINNSSNNVTIQITFNEPMDVSIAPTLTLNTELDDILNDETPITAGWQNSLLYLYVISINGSGLSKLDNTIDVTGAKDLAQNTMTPAQLANVKVDQVLPTLPTVTISSNNDVTPGDGTNAGFAKVGDDVTLNITASENLQSLTGNIAGTAGTPSGSGTAWTLARTMTAGDADGTVTFAINFADLAGNAGTPVTTVTNSSSITFDKTNPVVSITAPENGECTNGTQTLTFTVTEANPATATQAKIASGTLTDFTSGSAISSLNGWSAANEGTHTITVQHTDKAGNVGSATRSVIKDITAPTISSITLGNVTLGDNATKTTSDDVVTFTVTFSEPVGNFEYTDITLNKTGSINTPDIAVSGGPTTYTVTVGGTTNITGDGTLGITVSTSNIVDCADNALSAPMTSGTFTIDNTPPTVHNVVNNCNNSPVSGYSYNQAAQITFSEGVYTNSDATGALDNADLNVTASGGNATLQSWNVISGSHTAGGTTINITTNWNGTVLGNEQLRADAASATSIYDKAGNAMAVAGSNQGGPNPPKNWDYAKAQIVILTQPTNQTTCETGSAQFTTSAQGGLSVSYQWQYYDGSNWVNLTNTTINGATFSGATTSQLTITNPPYTNWNNVQFRCNVTNDCGDLATNTVTLTVNPDVSIQTQPSNQQACVGSVNSTFSVVATGTGPYTYTWQYFDGSNWNAVTNGTPTNASYDVSTPGSLNITGNIAAGTYQYRVIVGGGCGNPVTSSTVTLTINTVPNAGLTVTAQAGTVCTGSGTNIQVANSESGVSYQLRIGTTPVGSPVTGTGGTINLPTGNLTSNTTFNVLATNANCSVQLTQTPTVNVEQTPVNPTLASKTPNILTICQGTGVSATFNPGSGGTYDEFRYTTTYPYNWQTYNPGDVIISSDTVTIFIQGRRNASVCTPGNWSTLAAWNIEKTPVAPVLTKNPNTSAVCVGTNVSATLQTAGSGGTNTSSYYYRTKVGGNWGSWQTYNLGDNISTTGLEEVQIRARQNASFCSAAENIYSWTVNQLPTASISGTTPACQSTVLTASTNASSPSYQWKLNGNDITGATSSTYTATASGNYTVVVTDGSTGCSNESAQFAVTIHAQPVVYNVTGGPFCAGSNITIGLYGSENGYTYNVKLGTNTVATATGTGSSLSFNVTNASAGTYTVEAVNGTCTQAMSGSVTVNPAPTAYAGAPASTCGTTPVTVNDANATNYSSVSWTHNGQGTLTDANTLSPTYTPAVADAGNVVTLTLTANALAGCSNVQSTKQITVYPPLPAAPTITSSNGSSFCDVANTTLTASSSGATSYTWYSDAGLTTQIGTGATYTVTNLTSTATYYATASNSCGTSTSAGSFTVTVHTSPASPTITGSISVCQGATGITYSVPNTFSLYNWTVTGGSITAGQSTNQITVSWNNTPGTGTVSVTVTDANNCSASNSLNVTINALPTPVISGNNSVAVNTDLQLTSTNTYSSYNWTATGNPTITNNTSQTATFNWSTAGDYEVTLTVTDANGCSNSTTHNVTVNATQAPVITGNPTDATACDGGTAQFSVTSVSGIPTPTLEWQVNDGNGWVAVTGGDYSGANTTTLTINNVTGKNGYQYRLRATNGVNPDAFSTAATLTITTPSTPTVTITSSDNDNEFCSGSSITFTATATNTGGGTVAYQWKLNGNNVGSNQNTYTTNSLVNGDQVSCVITITGGCVTTNTATSNTITNTVLTVPAQPSAISGNTTVCQGQTGVAYSVTPVTGVTYTWSYSGSNATINGSGASITIDFANNATSGTLTVTPSNSCGNGTPQTLAITVSTLPTITTHPSAVTVAEGSDTSFSVTATGATSYEWYVNDGNGWQQISDGGVYSGSTTATLTITGATASMDSYQYKARAINTCGYTESNAATLTITAPTPGSQPTVTLSASTNSVNVSMTAPTTPTATGMYRLVLAGITTPSANPSNGTAYPGWNTDYSLASTLGNSRVVYDGNAASFTLSGLSSNTTYRVTVYGYNQIGTNTASRVYNTTVTLGTNSKNIKTKAKLGLEDEIISGNAFEVSRVSPNPASDEMYLTVISGNEGTYVFELYNSVGERVMGVTMELTRGNNDIVLPVKSNAGMLPAGVYNLRVRNGGEYIDQRVVIMP